MKQRFMVTPAVFVALVDEQNRVLLHRRANTGYMDGHYDFPSGHLEPSETIAEGALHEPGLSYSQFDSSNFEEDL